MISYELVVRRYGELSGEALLKPLIHDVFPDRIALVSSFGAESAVLLHMVSQVDRSTPIIFLDTGKLFQETLDYRDALVTRLRMTDVRSSQPAAADIEWHDKEGYQWFNNPDLCCQMRKVEPMERALQGFNAWITGRKRFHGGERSALRSLELADWRLKVNPLANWDAQDLARYMNHHHLPSHPLVAEGYRSIGCQPCTKPVAADSADTRAGRWAGSNKSECGIHWTANGRPMRVNG